MSERKQDIIQLLAREDCLRAMHNSYIEKFVGACLSEKFYQHRLENPKNGDDIEKIEESLKTAQSNIEYNELMLGFIDNLLENPEKITLLGKIDAKTG